MGGCGVVDPNVFDAVGIDSEKYTGWAFGFGIERPAMRKYGIPDIRLFWRSAIPHRDLETNSAFLTNSDFVASISLTALLKSGLIVIRGYGYSRRHSYG